MNIPPNLQISHAALKKLRSELPPGSIEVIVQRLKSKGIAFSFDYVAKVLNPNDPRMNTAILFEAIQYRDELIERSKEIERLIMNE